MYFVSFNSHKCLLMWTFTFQRWARAKESESHPFSHEWGNSDHFNLRAAQVSPPQTVPSPPTWEGQPTLWLAYVPTPQPERKALAPLRMYTSFWIAAGPKTGSSGQSAVASEFQNSQDWSFRTPHSPSDMKILQGRLQFITSVPRPRLAHLLLIG